HAPVLLLEVATYRVEVLREQRLQGNYFLVSLHGTFKKRLGTKRSRSARRSAAVSVPHGASSPVDRVHRDSSLPWNASAKRCGALHSTPRSRKCPRNRSSSNQLRESWDGNASSSVDTFFSTVSGASGTNTFG